MALGTWDSPAVAAVRWNVGVAASLATAFTFATASTVMLYLQ